MRRAIAAAVFLLNACRVYHAAKQLRTMCVHSLKPRKSGIGRSMKQHQELVSKVAGA
jgi:hypothetical protein